MRRSFAFASVALWIACLGVALFTIIPLSVLGLAAIFDGSFSFEARLQGLGFALLGLIVIAALFFALTRITRAFAKASNAPNH